MGGNLKRRVEKLEQASGGDFETKVRKLARRGFRGLSEDEVWIAVKNHERELNEHLDGDGITWEGLQLLVSLIDSWKGQSLTALGYKPCAVKFGKVERYGQPRARCNPQAGQTLAFQGRGFGVEVPNTRPLIGTRSSLSEPT